MHEQLRHQVDGTRQQIQLKMEMYKAQAMLHLAQTLLTEQNMHAYERFFTFTESEGALDALQEYIHTGYMPILYSNHQSHADILPMAIISGQIRETSDIQGFKMPSAISLNTGHQGVGLQTLSSTVDSWLKDKGIYFVPFNRTKDQQRYGIKGSNMDSTKEILRARKEGFGMAIFPEGSVQGGRHTDTGELYGMQEPDPAFGSLVDSLMNQGPVVFLPIGVHGTYNIIDPNKRFPTRRALTDFALEKTHLGQIHPLANVVIGQPFVLRDVTGYDPNAPKEERKQIIHSYMMSTVADLVPEEAQGIYQGIS